MESAFHPSAALLWGKEVILNLSSTVSIPALAFHSQEWPAWSQTRLAHVHILFCLGLREVFFFPTPPFTDEAVETQLGEMPWQVNGCGAQVFSPLSVVVFSLFHNSQCQAFQVRLQLKPLTFLSSSCVPLPLGYWDT